MAEDSEFQEKQEKKKLHNRSGLPDWLKKGHKNKERNTPAKRDYKKESQPAYNPEWKDRLEDKIIDLTDDPKKQKFLMEQVSPVVEAALEDRPESNEVVEARDIKIKETQERLARRFNTIRPVLNLLDELGIPWAACRGTSIVLDTVTGHIDPRAFDALSDEDLQMNDIDILLGLEKSSVEKVNEFNKRLEELSKENDDIVHVLKLFDKPPHADGISSAWYGEVNIGDVEIEFMADYGVELEDGWNMILGLEDEDLGSTPETYVFETTSREMLGTDYVGSNNDEIKYLSGESNITAYLHTMMVTKDVTRRVKAARRIAAAVVGTADLFD